MTDPTPQTASEAASARGFGWRGPVLMLSLVLNAVLLGILLADDGDGPSQADVAATDATTIQTTIPTTTAAAPTTTTTAPAATTTVPETDSAEPIRVLVAGDSVASQIGWALHGWSERNPGHIVVFNESHIGCGVVRYGQKMVDGLDGPVGDICSNWNEPVALHEAADTEIVSWPTAVELFRPDVVVSIVSSWDVTDRIVPGVVDDWASVGDPAYDTYVLGEYTEATRTLSAGGADVFWLMSPYLNRASLPEDHRDRVDGINDLVAEAIATVEGERPEASIHQVDYPGWIGEPGGPRDIALRDDGVHLSDQALAEIPEWLVGEMGLS